MSAIAIMMDRADAAGQTLEDFVRDWCAEVTSDLESLVKELSQMNEPLEITEGTKVAGVLSVGLRWDNCMKKMELLNTLHAEMLLLNNGGSLALLDGAL